MELLSAPETWVAISFIGFIALLIYYKVPGQITKALDSRADRIRTELEEAQKLREEAQGLLAEFRVEPADNHDRNRYRPFNFCSQEQVDSGSAAAIIIFLGEVF